MDRRKGEPTKCSPLPHDYLKMCAEVFTTNFDGQLKQLTQMAEVPVYFLAKGLIYADEVVLCVSLLEEDQLAATSVYASIDFDPKASAPSMQDLLSACVDGIGAVFGHLLSPEHPERMESVLSHSLGALEDVPFHWSEVKVERYRIYLKVDKANPLIEEKTDEWLRKNDPEFQAHEQEEEEETKKLFVTGPSAKESGGRGSSSGTLH